MKQRNISILVVFLFIVLAMFGHVVRLHGEIFFKGTDRQLEVIRVKGDAPGLTVLIFGGIHGDEPGGYFSSEKLSKVKLHSGNLIIVPRVNFPSIMMDRREISGDMNRKFGEEEEPNDPDAEVIKVLKGLMKEADVFINQHDAFGFHRETYESPKRNPQMYGQSLIVDSASFYSEKLKREINLSQMGQRILARVNKQISNKMHYFGFWDHDSLAKNTKFPEMRKSATYYALTAYSIPAFGVETSKDLPTLYEKVKYQLIVIREILHEFGLEAEFPPPHVDPPQLYWVEFLKNDKDVIRVNDKTNLRLKPGDKVVINKIFSNYETGLSADILNFGNLYDVGKEFVFKKDTGIRVKKNNMTIGLIGLKKYGKDSLQEIRLTLDGQEKVIPNWGKVDIKPGQVLKILKSVPLFPGIRFDVRGYERSGGSGDDSNVDITVENLISRYSFMEAGVVYFVKITTGKTLAGGFQIEVVK